jgi:integrase
MAWIRKTAGGRWQARHRGPDGREHQRTFPRRVDADAWLGEQRAAANRGAWVDERLGRIRLEEWVALWEPTTADLRESTRALNAGVVRKYLLPRFGSYPLTSITPAAVRAMVAEEVAAETLSNSAVRRHAIVLSVILGAAVAEGRIARNPCAGVKLPPENARRMRFLEPQEVAQLAAAVKPGHYRPLILTAAYVGLRWGELAGLRADRVDLLRRRIRVDQQLLDVAGRLSFGPPKTRAGVRLVSVPASLVDVLAEHLGSAPVTDSGLAFPTPSGLPMRRSNFRTVWRRTVADTPLEGLVFHELRHTAAALAIAQGAHPLAIKERLGHSSITVTMDTYGGLFPRLDEAIAEGLDEVLRRSLADVSLTSGVSAAAGTVSHLR